MQDICDVNYVRHLHNHWIVPLAGLAYETTHSDDLLLMHMYNLYHHRDHDRTEISHKEARPRDARLWWPLQPAAQT